MPCERSGPSMSLATGSVRAFPKRFSGIDWPRPTAMQPPRSISALPTATATESSRTLRRVLKWIRLAADRGSAWGQSNLGLMYEFGIGVRADPTEAVKWYRVAAEAGDAPAQWRLGVLLMEGNGVRRNVVAALVWLGIARDNGIDLAADDWETLRATLTAGQLREVAALADRCTESDYEDCP